MTQKSSHYEERSDVTIRRSRCEGVARGNLKSSLALLGTRLHFVRNDIYCMSTYLRRSLYIEQKFYISDKYWLCIAVLFIPRFKILLSFAIL
jgi:hypothetical protein